VSISRSCLLLTPLLALLAATPSPETTPGPGDADLARNRQLLDQWKSDPEHHARLQRDLHDFWALPKAQRRQLRQLDRDFHRLDAQMQKRLWKVAERYNAWLERLPDEARRHIEETRDTQERLRLIQAIRARQWMERLPHKVREDLDKLPEAGRGAAVARLREQERQQRILWKRPVNALARPKPTRPSELPPESESFIKDQLLPHLTPAERLQYNAALGSPEFSRIVKELAKNHPVLPPLSHKPIVRFDDLSDKAKVEAGSKISWEQRRDVWERLRRVEGKWPEWALTFHSLLSKEQRERMPPLGASRPDEFPVEVRDFIKKTLKPKVSPAEFRELQRVQGKWPEYPQHLLRLAEKHKLEVPGMSLPGSAEW
jgi:hypothetical protein